MKKLILFLAIIILNINCNDSSVDIKENQQPVILSLTVFPDTINLSDSAIVTCNAMDPDGDTLVYDWISDARLKIKGVVPEDDIRLYNTFENSHIFYARNINNRPLIDTAWVQCFARDRKGKSDARLILFIVKRDSLKEVNKN